MSTDDSDFHWLFFFDFFIPGVKYNIYGLRRFADNQIALLFYPIVVEI